MSSAGIILPDEAEKLTLGVIRKARHRIRNVIERLKLGTGSDAKDVRFET